MSKQDDFLDWLDGQDYYVNYSEVEERFPEIEFRPMIGITCSLDEDGNSMVPKRDYRQHLIHQ